MNVAVSDEPVRDLMRDSQMRLERPEYLQSPISEHAAHEDDRDSPDRLKQPRRISMTQPRPFNHAPHYQG